MRAHAVGLVNCPPVQTSCPPISAPNRQTLPSALKPSDRRMLPCTLRNSPLIGPLCVPVSTTSGTVALVRLIPLSILHSVSHSPNGTSRNDRSSLPAICAPLTSTLGRRTSWTPRGPCRATRSALRGCSSARRGRQAQVARSRPPARQIHPPRAPRRRLAAASTRPQSASRTAPGPGGTGFPLLTVELCRLACGSSLAGAHAGATAQTALRPVSRQGRLYPAAAICSAHSAARASSPSFSGPFEATTRKPSVSGVSIPPFF